MSTTDTDFAVRFPSRSRAGVFLGLGYPQLFLAAAALLSLATSLTLSAPWAVSGTVAIIAGILFALATITVRGESLLLLIARVSRFLFRSGTSQTKYRRNVWSRGRGTGRPAGDPGEHAPAPEVVSTASLPGALGDVAIVQLPGDGGGAFVHNAAAKLVAVTVSIRSTAWSLRDRSDREGAVDGIIDWFSSLESITGLTEASCRVRVDRAPSTELQDYVTARDAERTAAGLFSITPELEREYDALISLGAKKDMSFTNTVTLVFSTEQLAREIRGAGGGLVGIAALLDNRVDQLRKACETARVEFDQWLNATQLQEMISTAFDPVTAARLREQSSSRRELRGGVATAPPLMAVDETFQHVQIDATFHQTFWMSEWPRTETRAGFLEPLLYTGDCTRVLALQMRPVPLEQALKDLNRAQAGQELAASVRFRLQQRVTRRQERETEDLDQREDELVNGFGDVQLRGFLTVSAESADALARARSDIEQAQHPARVKLASMWGQQAASFVTGTLPVPTGTK